MCIAAALIAAALPAPAAAARTQAAGDCSIAAPGPGRGLISDSGGNSCARGTTPSRDTPAGKKRGRVAYRCYGN